MRTFIVTAGGLDLAYATLHVERFRLSSLETRIDLWLILQENTEKAARALADKYGVYELVDEQGKLCSTAKWITWRLLALCNADQWVCWYLSEMPGLLQFPESVGFIAGDTELIRLDLGIEE